MDPVLSNPNAGIRVFETVTHAPPQFIGDKMLIAYKGFIAESSDGTANSIVEKLIENIPLEELGNLQLITCMDYCDAINDYSLIDIRVFSRHDKGLVSPEDYSIDWKRRSLNLLKYHYGTVYYIAVYMDRRQMKEALKESQYERIDGSVTKPTIIPNPN